MQMKNMLPMSSIIRVTFCFYFCLLLNAQTPLLAQSKDQMELGFNLGPALFFGDGVQGIKNAIKTPSWVPGVSFLKPIGAFGLKAQFQLLSLRDTIYDVKSKGWSLGIMGSKGFVFGDKKPIQFFVETGLFLNSGKAQFKYYNDSELTKEKFTAIGIPIGAGFKFPLLDSWKIGFEIQGILPTGDKYDGINQNNNDGYVTTGITIARVLSKKRKETPPDPPFVPKPVPKDLDADKDEVLLPDDKCPTLVGYKCTGGCPDTLDFDGDKEINDADPCKPCTSMGASFARVNADDFDGDGVKNIDDDAPCQKGPKCNKGKPSTDSDCDGLADSVDNCPDEKGTVELKGCPILDKDKDGILDSLDRCKDTPGFPCLDGCPDTADRDQDKEENDSDPCVPCTAEGVSFKKYSDADLDGDGIKNIDDAAPCKKGPKCNRGAPTPVTNDRDCDGIADSQDKCPEVRGSREDNDGDGIRDVEDLCPCSFAKEACGCPGGDNPKGDVDKDGIRNAIDDCLCAKIGTPQCPDEDKDGFPDAKDRFPFDRTRH